MSSEAGSAGSEDADTPSDGGSAGSGERSADAGAAGKGPASPMCSPESARGVTPSIDDFEDGDTLLQTSNRHGYWYAHNDGSGMQVPKGDPSGATFAMDAPGAPTSPLHALHTSGSGFRVWGAFVSTNLNTQANMLCPYDVSSFSGVKFDAKGKGALRVEIGTRVTTPVGDGGACASALCSDYGLDVTLSDGWAEVRIPFDDIRLPVWASPAPWKPDEVVRLSFWVEKGDFDFWIDDVTFY